MIPRIRTILAARRAAQVAAEQAALTDLIVAEQRRSIRPRTVYGETVEAHGFGPLAGTSRVWGAK